MASKGERAGKAFVEMSLQDDPLRKSLRGVGGLFSSLGGRLRSIGGAMTGVGAGIASAFALPLAAASDAQETFGKFDTVFGDNAKSMRAWTDELGAATGVSQVNVANFASGLQDLFVPMGIAEGEATKLTKTLTTLAIDLASFNNSTPEEVIRDLQSAMTGSGETMKKYGVLVDAAAVKQELLAKGIKDTDATNAEKAAARLAIIMRSTTAAQGDAIRTAGSFANQVKALRARLSDLAVVIGDAIIKPATKIVSYVGRVIAQAFQWAQANQGLIATVAAVGAGLLLVGSTLFGLGVAFQAIAFAATGLATAIGLVVAGLATIVSPIGLVVAGVGLGTAAFLTFTETGQNMVDKLLGLFGDLKDTALRSFSAISAALAAGDIQAAGEVLWAGLQLLFLQGTAGITETWHKAIGGIAKIWHSTWAGMLQLFNYVGSTIGNVWDRVMGGLAKSWNYVAAVVQKGWAYVKSFFDSGIDYATEAARIDAELTTKNAGVDANSASSISQRDQAYADRLDQIGADLAAKLDRADDGTEAAIKAAEATLADAKAAFAEAETAALTSVQAAEAQLASTVPPESEESSGGTVAGTSAGLFNAAAIGSLFRASGGPEEQTAKATERTAKATEALLAVAQEGGTFA